MIELDSITKLDRFWSHFKNCCCCCCCWFEMRMQVIRTSADKEVVHFQVAELSPSPWLRHQTTGAVIARCGQPEVSWWGWRNADDEHLVQSIAKACAVDGSSRKHLSNGGYANGHDLPDSDFGESADWPWPWPRPRPPPQTSCCRTGVFT